MLTIVLWVVLMAGCHGRLHSGDVQDLAGYPVPSANPPSVSSVSPGGISRNPYYPFPQEESTEADNNYSTRGNLRKSFSYESIKNPRGKERYEALKSKLNEQDEIYNKNNSQHILNKGLYVRQRNVYPSTTTEKSQHKADKNTSPRSISGPNVDGQQPYRHWSTESNVIREEHPDGLYSSYPYVTPTGSTQENDYSRNNLKKIYELSSTEGYNPIRRVYPNVNQHAIIPPTTYRPSTTTEPSGYSFSFSSKKNSRHESGDSKGNFRGSIKYLDTSGGTKQIDYEGNPEIGIVTTERTPVVNIPGKPRQRYIPPRTSWPASTTRNGLTYSYSSPLTNLGYSPSTTQTPQATSQLINRRGKTIYKPPQFYYQPVETYMTANMGDPYMYYTEAPQYAMLPPNYGAYMFSFDAGDHERREIRDKEGNVRGMYSFDGTDGERKQVNYEANSGRGFVARGRHLPVQPEDLSSPQNTYQESSISPENEPTSFDGTYFFSYNAGGHMRQERKDENGNIHGIYSFLTGDGIRKTVKYRASPSEGFVAMGDDIPNQPDGSYSVNYKFEQQQGYPPETTENKYQPKISIK